MNECGREEDTGAEMTAEEEEAVRDWQTRISADDDRE